jgi:hypothetical protein
MSKIVIDLNTTGDGRLRISGSAASRLVAKGHHIYQYGDALDAFDARRVLAQPLVMLNRPLAIGPIVLVDAFDPKVRCHPDLVAVVEELGSEAGDLKVIEIPDDVEWIIDEHEGSEYVAEKHRTWY